MTGGDRRQYWIAVRGMLLLSQTSVEAPHHTRKRAANAPGMAVAPGNARPGMHCISQ